MQTKRDIELAFFTCASTLEVVDSKPEKLWKRIISLFCWSKMT
jgi:hypothetical protein